LLVILNDSAKRDPTALNRAILNDSAKRDPSALNRAILYDSAKRDPSALNRAILNDSAKLILQREKKHSSCLQREKTAFVAFYKEKK